MTRTRTAAARPAARPPARSTPLPPTPRVDQIPVVGRRYAQPRRSLSEGWEPGHRYERELVDLLIAPSLAHYADVLLLRDGAENERPPVGKDYWPAELRHWHTLWPQLLVGRGTHLALSVAWWTRLDSARRGALRAYLALDPSEYDPNIGPDVGAWEAEERRREGAAAAAEGAARPAPPVGDTPDRGEAAAPALAAVGLW
jgi:hypothetical protein